MFSIPMRGNEIGESVEALAEPLEFSIPMRGNERSGSPRLRVQDSPGFSIPMRGNEYPDAKEISEAETMFSIPMRGNEAVLGQTASTEGTVFDPHEG